MHASLPVMRSSTTLTIWSWNMHGVWCGKVEVRWWTAYWNMFIACTRKCWASGRYKTWDGGLTVCSGTDSIFVGCWLGAGKKIGFETVRDGVGIWVSTLGAGDGDLWNGNAGMGGSVIPGDRGICLGGTCGDVGGYMCVKTITSFWEAFWALPLWHNDVG